MHLAPSIQHWVAITAPPPIALRNADVAVVMSGSWYARYHYSKGNVTKVDEPSARLSFDGSPLYL